MLSKSRRGVKRSAVALMAAVIIVAAGCATAFQAPPISIQQAVADPRRPAGDVALDATRHGADVLALGDIQPGWKVADLMQGAGYYTRLFVAKVGATGKVYAWSPEEFIEAKPALYGDSLDILARDYPDNLVPMRSNSMISPSPRNSTLSSHRRTITICISTSFRAILPLG